MLSTQRFKFAVFLHFLLTFEAPRGKMRGVESPSNLRKFKTKLEKPQTRIQLATFLKIKGQRSVTEQQHNVKQ